MKARIIKLWENIQIGTIDKAAYIYLLLPLFIFSIFWLRWYYVLVAIPFFVYLFYRILFNDNGSKSYSLFSKKNRQNWIIIILIICGWVALSGIGKLVYQNNDHSWRNTMFEILCNYRWPVTGNIKMDGVSSERGFSYYIGFWLPAAFVGKIFGVNAGYFFQVIWAVLGIFIFYCKVCEKRNKVEVWPLILFILFSGMDSLGAYLAGLDISELSHTLHLEWWCGALQFSSFTTQLFWVYNQAIPAWIATMLLFSASNNKKIFLLWAVMLLNGTLPAIGLIPFILLQICKYCYNNAKRKSIFWHQLYKELWSFENIAGGIICIVSVLYLFRSSGAEVSLFRDLSNGGWLIYLLFIFMEIGVYVVICYRKQKRNFWFLTAIIWLCICPLLQVYGEKNFCMRASIPALVILWFYVIESFRSFYSNKQSKCLVALCIGLLIGSMTPVHEINRTIAETKKKYWAEEPIEATSLTITDVLSNEYESVDTSESFFFKYLAQNKE